MKVHLTVSESLAATPEGREALLQQLDRFGFRCLNPERFARFGILTGEVPAEVVDRLREVVGIEAVEKDQKKYAT